MKFTDQIRQSLYRGPIMNFNNQNRTSLGLQTIAELDS